MFGLSRNTIILAVAAAGLALGIGGFFYGQRIGRLGCEAKHSAALVKAQKAQFDAAELASKKEDARLAAEAERELLVQQLEDAARADPVQSPACLPVDRVRRLNKF